MIGTFNYTGNCAIPHYFPQGKVVDGYPVIVFPAKESEITIGGTYDFVLQMSLEATYTIDDTVYRVGHAVAPMECEGKTGDAFDAIVHRPSMNASPKLGDCLDEETVGKLAAFRAKLAAK